MKLKMLKAVNAGGAFRKVGDLIDVTDEQASELIRTGVAEVSTAKPKGKPKGQYKV